jgi:hypothetical protein
MAADTSFKVWVADSLVKVLPGTAAPAGPAGTVTIDAVRNEYESGQIVVTAGARIEKLTASVSDLTGPSGPKPRVQANFVGFVPVRKGTVATPPERLVAKPPVDIPDPLLVDKSESVDAGTNKPVWLTVYVPKTAKPGTYAGSVGVTCDGATVQIPISICVHSATLPDARTLYLTNWFSYGNVAVHHGVQLWSETWWKLIDAYAHCMAEHRQNVIITPIMDLIQGRDDGKGKLSFDFSRFDRWVELFKKAGVIGKIEGGHLGTRGEWLAKDFNAILPEITNPDGSVKPKPSVMVTSEEFRTFLSQFLPALRKHLEEKGWLGIYLQHLCDEPIKENADSYKKLSTYVRQYAPKFKIIDACMWSELVGAIDIWVPLPEHYERDIKFFQDRQKAGDQVWFYTCLAPKGKYMNRFLDYPLIDVRLLHWVNFKYDLTGYLHWGFNYSTAKPFEETEPGTADNYLPPGDSHITYPGPRGPLSSIRLEALRDGVEDYELLKLLEKKNPKKARAICDSIVRSLTDYTLDPAEFRAARLKLIEAL